MRKTYLEQVSSMILGVSICKGKELMPASTLALAIPFHWTDFPQIFTELPLNDCYSNLLYQRGLL